MLPKGPQIPFEHEATLDWSIVVPLHRKMRTVRTYLVTIKAVDPDSNATELEQQVRLDIQVHADEPGVASTFVKRAWDEDTGTNLELPLWLTGPLCTKAATEVLAGVANGEYAEPDWLYE